MPPTTVRECIPCVLPSVVSYQSDRGTLLGGGEASNHAYTGVSTASKSPRRRVRHADQTVQSSFV